MSNTLEKQGKGPLKLTAENILHACPKVMHIYQFSVYFTANLLYDSNLAPEYLLLMVLNLPKITMTL